MIVTCSALYLMATASAAAEAETLAIDSSKSVFAIVTHKGGVGAALAHNHLVTLSEYDATLKGEAGQAEHVSFEFEAKVEHLVFDDPESQEQWFPAIKDAGILDDPFSDISDKDRAEIRESALDEGQLDAENFETVTARMESLRPATGADADSGHTHTAELEVTIRGKAVTRDIPVTLDWEGNSLSVAAEAPFKFTDFGIEPYSAFLGAVRNKDEFHLFVRIHAQLPKK